MQEYFAAMLGLEIGDYYHIANNFHYYEDKRNMLENIAGVRDYKDAPYTYKKRFLRYKNLMNWFQCYLKKKEK